MLGALSQSPLGLHLPLPVVWTVVFLPYSVLPRGLSPPWLWSFMLMVSGSPAPNPILNSRSMYFHWNFLFFFSLLCTSFYYFSNSQKQSLSFFLLFFFCFLWYLWKIISLNNMIIFLLLDFFSFRSTEIFYRKLELIMSNWISNLPLFPLIILNLIHHQILPNPPCLCLLNESSAFHQWHQHPFFPGCCKIPLPN